MDSYRERITNFSNEFDLGLFIYIVKRSLIWIVLCILLAFSAAWIYLRYTPNTYDSKAIIQLKEHNNAHKVLEVNRSPRTRPSRRTWNDQLEVLHRQGAGPACRWRSATISREHPHQGNSIPRAPSPWRTWWCGSAGAGPPISWT
ncbi:MAG: hypothetical protein IPN38_05970 [Flavobacteriales bacterium]|nr:hypothetical protein [Flavobacteriales bacterium]